MKNKVKIKNKNISKNLQPICFNLKIEVFI